MKKESLRLIHKEPLSSSGALWRLRFDAPDIEALPGQFVNIEVGGHYLRRPISVSEYSAGELTLVVQVAGDGTRRMVATPEGSSLDMLTGLGNPFTLPGAVKEGPVAVIGGGVGYAPLVGLLRRLHAEGVASPLAVFGFNRAADVPEAQLAELDADGLRVAVATMSGEAGEKGTALDVALRLLRESGREAAYFFTCGPMPMMKAVADAFACDGQLSLEARMGCGFGACMGCSVKLEGSGFSLPAYARICREGPVFAKSVLMPQPAI